MDINYKGYHVSIFGQIANIYKGEELEFCIKAKEGFKWTTESIEKLVDLYINFDKT